MGDFDEKTGFDVIKDSMGLTDQDLAPSGDMGDDFESTGESSNDFDGDRDGSLDGSARDDFSRSTREGDVQRTPLGQPSQNGQRPPSARDPLRETPLKFDPQASFQQDKKGNLIDSRTGEIVARAGSEARIYKRVHKEATDYIGKAMNSVRGQMMADRSKLQRAVELGLGFEKQVGELRNTLNQINAHQLDTDQLLEAAQYYKQAQSDPIGVLKNLLTRAAVSGIDVSQLGVQGATNDVQAIVNMVRQEIQQNLAPVNNYAAQQRQAQEKQQADQRYYQQAEQQVGEFFAKTPEAVPYTQIFHAVLSQPQFQNMSLGQIWDKLQLNLMRSGIDPRSGQRQRGNGTTRQPAPAARSLPNGRGMAPYGSDRGRVGNAGPAHPSASYDAIIREVLGNAR